MTSSVGVLVAAALCASVQSRADETALHPAVRLGWSNAESAMVEGGIGTAWPRGANADWHVRLAAGGGIGLGGASVFIESGVCRTAEYQTPRPSSSPDSDGPSDLYRAVARS
jgi:hypothetical protein